jgi:hypothetical protein
MAAEFKIGRLRFNWAGSWEPLQEYNRDAVIEYNGKMYVCLIPNTSSSNFYDDLYAVAEDSSPTPYWDIIMEGRTWLGEWQPSTLYSLNNLVLFGGKIYKCTTAHTSGLTAIDPTKFETYVESANWSQAWTPSANYGVGDVVKYGGIVYVCTANHTSANSINLGLEIDILNWDILNVGIEYKGAWSSGTRYKLNDVVKLNANLYIATVQNGPAGSFAEENWDIWLPGQSFANAYNSSTTYQPGDIVIYGGYSYVSNTFNNQNNLPSTDEVNWTLLNTGYSMKGIWSSATNYKLGDVVSHGGYSYKAIADNLNQNPSFSDVSTLYTAAGSSGTTIKVSSTTGLSKGMQILGYGFTKGQYVVSVDNLTTIKINEAPERTLVDNQSLQFVGLNYVYWAVEIPGTTWNNNWVAGTNYEIGDVAVYKNGTYVCVQNHTGILSYRPDADTTNSYWIPYVLHARKNALSVVGELETYNNGAYDSVAIGTQDYALQLVDSTPTWSHLNTIPAVYYVAPSGTDTLTDGWGLTWDKPWKTIKFAADTIGAGLYYPNAAYLLRQNKDWLTNEMYQWMLYQKAYNISPFTTSSTFDQAKTIRDAAYVIDAAIYDITRGGNSQSVATALAYFELGTTGTFFNAEVAAQMPYFTASLNYLSGLITSALNQSAPAANYQQLNLTWSPSTTYNEDDVVFYNGGYYASLIDNNLNSNPSLINWISTSVPESIVFQVTDNSKLAETTPTNATTLVGSLVTIIRSALSLQTTTNIPASNDGTTATIMVKTGTYEEITPIVIPANVALNGDELRGVTVRPANIINTVVTAASSSSNLFTVVTTEGMVDGTPVQFSSRTVNGVVSTIGGVTAGQTYYVLGITLTPTQFSVSTTPNGTVLPLITGSGTATVYGGGAINDMFYVRNGSGIRNMTLNGMLGFLSDFDEFELKRPTGGSYVSLDPGNGPNDTSAWIYRRSPYIQNVTAFGSGCAALKIDGNLHNGGNKSIVCNDFTHILSDGIGVWCTGPGALTEAVSVFSYYGYAGYMAEAGGRIRATNGNSSYGTYGVVAVGFDETESPITGTVYNQSLQTQAQVQSAFGSTAELIKINFNNAGSNYDIPTTNMLSYSNEFTNGDWNSDGNLNFSKIYEAPSGFVEAWAFSALSNSAGTGYIHQNIPVTPKGAIYTNVSAVNISGSGIGATFDVTVTSTEYIVTVNNPGNNYTIYSGLAGSSMYISGGQLGGRNNINDCILTVTGLSGSGVQGVDVSGTVPAGSALNYTASVYVKKGSATNVGIEGIFSGSSSVTSTINFNFDTELITTSSANSGFLPVNYGATAQLAEGWYRLWFAINDSTGLNTQLQFRIYAKGTGAGDSGKITYFYGAQVEVSNVTWLDYSPSFYLETISDHYTSYANFNIVGAGTGVVTLGDEIRSKSVFETRVTDPGSGAGGSGYLTASNNAQAGNDSSITLAQSDTNTQANYTGMRLFINSGTGAGQYGYISAYNDATKEAQILKESFDPLEITNTASGTDLLTLGSSFNTNTLYVDQRIQFIPTYYTTSITSTSLAQASVTQAQGGTINQLTVSSTLGMKQDMAIQFTGDTFSSIVTGYIYFIYDIIDEFTIQITDQLFGNVWPLTTAAGLMTANFTSNTSYLTGSTTNMVVNYPIQFTGTSLGGLTVGQVYYINDIISGTYFSISESLVEITVTATNPSGNVLTVASTATLIPLTPIVFSGGVVGNIVDGTKYYISKIIDSFTFNVSTSLLTVSATSTEAISNLITVTSTTGFVVNNPIKFVGTSFGGITSETIYYVLAINGLTSFTMSQTPGGGAVSLTTESGSLTVRTAPAAFTLSSSSGASMTGVSTSTKTSLGLSIGAMNGTFSTSLFGGVDLGTTYFIKTISSINRQITISDSLGGATYALTTKTGSMKLAAVGWDNIITGKPASLVLDNSSVYFIEPRTTFSDPEFTQTISSPVLLAPGTSWVSVAYGDHYWMALPSGNSTAAGSSDGNTWSSITLPSVQTWTSIAYGNGYWVAISSGGSGNSKAIYSNSNGLGWRTVNLPSATTWSHVTYGNGVFVAIAAGTSTSAYSIDYGKTWLSGTSLPNATWTGLTYGKGKFLAVASGGTTAAYSTNGQSWTSSTLPSSTTWSNIAYGSERFVAVSSTSSKTAYTFDGINWYESLLPIVASRITYGQGVFLTVSSANGIGYISENGLDWQQKLVSNDGYSCVSFGYTITGVDGRPGYFVTLAGQSTGSYISAGTKTKARAIITSGIITSLSEWESGSGYQSVPTVTFTDPNITALAVVSPRIGDGALGSPTFINNGTGYNTNSTTVKITGNGYADTYQTGLTIILNNLTQLPQPGDNLTIAGVDQIYKVTSSFAVYGTSVPTLEANVQISPAMSIELSPENNAAVEIRAKYSQARLTNHDFLNIGYGSFETSNYPGFPDTGYEATQQSQVVEANYGRVFYTSTDQDGNFKVGSLFGVQQATGIVTLSASQFGLTGLETLSLGGIAVGGSSVVVTQFSTDASFVANSDSIIPTQKAIKSYLAGRLSQGGANTFTGQLTAGTVIVGGADQIRSTVPNGVFGSVVNMPNLIKFEGSNAGVDGNMAALGFFIRNSTRRVQQ